MLNLCWFLMHGLAGIVLETDSGSLVNRVSMRGTDADVPLHEQVLVKTDVGVNAVSN